MLQLGKLLPLRDLHLKRFVGDHRYGGIYPRFHRWRFEGQAILLDHIGENELSFHQGKLPTDAHPRPAAKREVTVWKAISCSPRRKPFWSELGRRIPKGGVAVDDILTEQHLAAGRNLIGVEIVPPESIVDRQAGSVGWFSLDGLESVRS